MRTKVDGGLCICWSCRFRFCRLVDNQQLLCSNNMAWTWLQILNYCEPGMTQRPPLTPSCLYMHAVLLLGSMCQVLTCVTSNSPCYSPCLLWRQIGDCWLTGEKERGSDLFSFSFFLNLLHLYSFKINASISNPSPYSVNSGHVSIFSENSFKMNASVHF